MSDGVSQLMGTPGLNGSISGTLAIIRPGSWSVTTGDLWLFAGLCFAIGFVVALILVFLVYGWTKKGGGRQRVDVA